MRRHQSRGDHERTYVWVTHHEHHTVPFLLGYGIQCLRRWQSHLAVSVFSLKYSTDLEQEGDFKQCTLEDPRMEHQVLLVHLKR